MDAMPTSKLRGSHAGVEFLEDHHDLGFGEAGFLHVSLLGPEARYSQFQLEPFSHLTSPGTPNVGSIPTGTNSKVPILQ